jgi:hypothetical protein
MPLLLSQREREFPVQRPRESYSELKLRSMLTPMSKLLAVALVVGLLSFTGVTLTGCASTPEPKFSARYGGTAQNAHLKLDLLRSLPERGTSGWLVYTDSSVADARVSTHAGGYPTYDVQPSYVKFATWAPDDPKHRPAGTFHWDGDEFVVCMVYVQFLSTPGSDKIHLGYDYTTYCAPMHTVQEI